MRSIIAQGVASITRRYPLCSGCGTLANTRALRWLTPGNPEVWATLRTGERIRVRPNDWVGRSIFFFGDLDPKISWVLERLLRPGDVAIDIGANQGLVTFRAAGLVGPSGLVHAFEPQPGMMSLLARTLREEPRPQVHLHELALSDRPGRRSLSVPDDNAGAGSLEFASSGGTTVEVRLERLDAIAALQGRAARLMKIDVEGHEESVLRGASGYLERFPPEVILFESQDDRPLRDRPTVQLLKSHGYAIADLPRARLRPRPAWVDQDGSTRGHDLIAVHTLTGAEAAARLGLVPEGRVSVAHEGLEAASAAP